MKFRNTKCSHILMFPAESVFTIQATPPRVWPAFWQFLSRYRAIRSVANSPALNLANTVT